jgi:NADH-quinone oxidoreductase subunit M
MNQLGFPLLSLIIFLPLVGALSILLVGSRRRLAGAWALVVALIDLVLALVLLSLFDPELGGMQFVDRFAWIEPLGIAYSVGVDGISLWLLVLTALLSPLCVLLSWNFLDDRSDVDARSYFFFLLSLQTGTLGVFAALDLVLFYIFWEAVLIPAYFLVGRWGGERRIYAALKFILYTMAGSALMLVAILALVLLNQQATGALTFDLQTMYDLPLSRFAQTWLFLAFLVAFAVKAPIWPLHTWLPDAYVESPLPVTILLAAVLSKMGVYGLIRFCLPLFPDALAVLRPWIWVLAIAGIVYGSLVALVQRDMKRLVAYSSLAHLGMIVTGVLVGNVQGVEGALLLSVSHGLTVTALFAFVGFLEARRGTRSLDAFGGLWSRIPVIGTLLLTVILASIGLPGLSGFPGEFTLLVGVFRSSPVAAAFATLGIVLGAWYMLNLFRRVFSGPLSRPENRGLADLGAREALVILPLVALMLVIGILPNLILHPTQAAVVDMLDLSEQRQEALMGNPDDLALSQVADWAPSEWRRGRVGQFSAVR